VPVFGCATFAGASGEGALWCRSNVAPRPASSGRIRFSSTRWRGLQRILPLEAGPHFPWREVAFSETRPESGPCLRVFRCSRWEFGQEWWCVRTRKPADSDTPRHLVSGRRLQASKSLPTFQGGWCPVGRVRSGRGRFMSLSVPSDPLRSVVDTSTCNVQRTHLACTQTPPIHDLPKLPLAHAGPAPQDTTRHRPRRPNARLKISYRMES
jgi:hypothetical protein